MRTPRVDRNGLRQGAWSTEEDRRLIDYISKYRIWNWSLMPKYAGLSRNGKSCRLRWVNYLDPNIRRGNISKDEEKIIIDMYAKLGSRWSKIAARLPGRTDNEIKNYWHTHLKKLFKEEPKKRIDPLAIKIPNFEANLENSYGINKTAPTPSASGSEASNSYDSNNPTLSRESYDDLREIDQVRIDSSETIGDFHSFWAKPEVHFEDWYQEPLSPYGIFNNEYWLNEFGVMDGMEQPNFYYKSEF